MSAPAAHAPQVGPIGRLGGSILEILQILGECVTLFGATVVQCRHAFRHREKVLGQLIAVGTESMGIAALVSLFIGMVMVLQAAEQLSRFTQEILGALVAQAMTKELGPVVMGFLIAGRAGSAIAAEIGSMKVYDEIAALETMDINPVTYLAMPRFIAMTLILPMLVLYSDVIGILGGALVVHFDPSVTITVWEYFDNLTEWLNAQDIVVGLVKGGVFGMVISIVAVTFGLRTQGGSQGVAMSTTAAVVWGFVLMVIADYLIVRTAFLWNA